MTKLKTLAAGSKRYKEYNGYYTWPRMGYEGQMTPAQYNNLPDAIQDALDQTDDRLSVRNLFDKVKGGAEAWKEYGSDLFMEFDLKDDSPSMKALEAYRSERRGR